MGDGARHALGAVAKALNAEDLRPSPSATEQAIGRLVLPDRPAHGTVSRGQRLFTYHRIRPSLEFARITERPFE